MKWLGRGGLRLTGGYRCAKREACAEPFLGWRYNQKGHSVGEDSGWGRIARPIVVWEVGFSEDLEDLRCDVGQWLVKAGGKTRAVVMVDIQEDQTACQDRRATQAFKLRLSELLRDFGNEKAKLKRRSALTGGMARLGMLTATPLSAAGAMGICTTIGLALSPSTWRSSAISTTKRSALVGPC